MDLMISEAARAELPAAFLQLFVTLGLALLCAILHAQYRKPYFALWAAAWLLYATRIGSIVMLVQTGVSWWLFWHQVVTGWTAIALLWAALVFSQRTAWRTWYWLAVAVPLVWSYVAIYMLESFFWAAGPMVVFLSLTTGWTAWAFLRYDRLVGSPAARFLVAVLVLWAIHHLDYPFLRAQGAWNPWGYYLDIFFEMGMGLGILFLVLEDLDQGLRTLTSLSGELQGRGVDDEPMAEAMLRRALSLRGVHGSALYLATPSGGAFVHGAGVAALWPYEGAPGPALESSEWVQSTGLPALERKPDESGRIGWSHAYTAALPVIRDDDVVGALVVVGQARDPLTVLDNRFLLAFGQQVGAALENEDLHRSLESRTEELERLQARMIHQHEEERNRLWRELHDETAQVLAALNLQLGLLEERADTSMAQGLDRAKKLAAEGIKSIRSVTRNLRPIALDDLGLIPSLCALVRDFQSDDAFVVDVSAPATVPALHPDAELVLYRALQEALSNAVRHAQCSRVEVSLVVEDEQVRLSVHDNGTGIPEDALGKLSSRGGLAGLRERTVGVRGDFQVGNHEDGGVVLRVGVPKVQTEDEP
ncbi:MAG: GAF domain-containing protein [Gemmatimonadales bacterium]|nr:GAF domain-containing protein [Gemmatimonadales bacterium]